MRAGWRKSYLGFGTRAVHKSTGCIIASAGIGPWEIHKASGIGPGSLIGLVGYSNEYYPPNYVLEEAEKVIARAAVRRI